MNNEVLLKETIELIKQVKSEYSGAGSCALETLDQALENLAQLEHEKQLSKSDMSLKSLAILSKVIKLLPEIQSLLERFGLL